MNRQQKQAKKKHKRALAVVRRQASDTRAEAFRQTLLPGGAGEMPTASEEQMPASSARGLSAHLSLDHLETDSNVALHAGAQVSILEETSKEAAIDSVRKKSRALERTQRAIAKKIGAVWEGGMPNELADLLAKNLRMLIWRHGTSADIAIILGVVKRPFSIYLEGPLPPGDYVLDDVTIFAGEIS